MDNTVQEKIIPVEPKRNFWIGLLIGSLTNVFGFIIAFFVKKKKLRKGIIAGAIFTILAAVMVII